MLSPIRKATQEDKIRLEKSAERFCKRHNINREGIDNAVDAIDYHIDRLDNQQQRTYLNTLWKRCACRALQLPPKGGIPIIAYGYVGTSN